MRYKSSNVTKKSFVSLLVALIVLYIMLTRNQMQSREMRIFALNVEFKELHLAKQFNFLKIVTFESSGSQTLVPF